MQLTPEQRQQVEKAKVTGEKRVLLDFTAGQKEQWQAAGELEQEGKDANIAHARKMKEATERPGFIGDNR